MATLAGNTIASTYPLLLKIDSSGIDATLRVVEDGDATDSALLIATNKVEVKPGSNDANAFEVSQADGTAVFTIDTSSPAFSLTGTGTITKAISASSGDNFLLNIVGTEASGADLGAGDNVGILFKTAYETTTSKKGSAIVATRESGDDTDSSTGLAFKVSQNDETLDEAVRIDHDKNVGIGTASPTDYNANSDNLVIFETGDDSGITLVADNDRGSNIYFADAQDDNVGGISYNHSNNKMTLRGNGSSKMEIDSAGNIGIGATPTTFHGDLTGVQIGGNGILQHETAAGASKTFKIAQNVREEITSGDFTYISTDEASLIELNSGGVNIKTAPSGTAGATATMTSRLTLLQAGNVGIGTTSPGDYSTSGDDFVVKGSDHTGISIVSPTNKSGNIMFADGTSGDAQYKGFIQYDHGNNLTDVMVIGTNGSEKMRINSDGQVLIGKTDTSFNVVGISLVNDGRIGLKTDGQEALNLNRAQDGAVAEFRSADTAEGTISISGSTVSYNGFSGSHESSGIPTDTAIGTVVSTIDELDVYPNTDYKTGEAHNKAGETRADHAKIKISDSVGDRRVYGVLASFNEDNKPIVASVGIGSVKVTGACQGGDLLESNGDGTAKVQDDDIIRSKTIGKVTIGDSNTGVKLVSCVLYCG